jgi:dTDP-4-dehydrorhamnose reductase
MELSKDTRVFITGCGGMLGLAVYGQFSERCNVLATDIDLNEPWLEYADVTNYEKTYQIAAKFKPHVIINLAALTDLEYCEQNVEETFRTNGLGAENMALIAQKLNAVHIYICTAGIFDGTQEYYNDFDRPNPLSVYAKGKYHGELAVERMLEKYYVFRAGWMMGGGLKKDKKFINKIYKQIVGGSRTLNVVDDKLGTPTYTVNFAESMFRILQTDMYGLYNMVCRGSCSRYDVAKEFISLLGIEQHMILNIVDSNYFSKEYFAPRPLSEKLVNLKLESRGINYMRDWRECLKDYSQEFKHDLQSRIAPPVRKRELVTA